MVEEGVSPPWNIVPDLEPPNPAPTPAKPAPSTGQPPTLSETTDDATKDTKDQLLSVDTKTTDGLVSKTDRREKENDGEQKKEGEEEQLVEEEVGEARVSGYPRARLLPTCQVASDRVFLCRKVYDSR